MKITAAEIKRLTKMDSDKRHEYFSKHYSEINFDHLIKKCRTNQLVTVGEKQPYTNDDLENVVESAVVFTWVKNHAHALVSTNIL